MNKISMEGYKGECEYGTTICANSDIDVFACRSEKKKLTTDY